MENVLTPLQWATDTPADDDDGLPEPSGYRLLVKPFEVESVSKGGIVLVEESKQYADIACIVGQVVKMGDDCYKDARFEKPWCKTGDWIVFAKHCGQKFELKKPDGKTEKFIFINDDDVRATVKDPARIRMYL